MDVDGSKKLNVMIEQHWQEIVKKGVPVTGTAMISEVEFLESEKRFQDVAMLIPAVIIEWDASFRMKYINKMGYQIFQLTKEHLDKGVYLFDMISEADRTKTEKDIYNIFHGDFGNAAEYDIKRLDGKILHLLVNSVPIVPTGGMRTCIVDITGRVEAETKLKESEKRFKSIVSWSPIGIALCDKTGAISEMNNAFSTLFGLKKSGSLQETKMPFSSGFDFLKSKQKDLDNGESVEFETMTDVVDALKNVAVKRCLTWHITPLEKNLETYELFLVQVQDITEKKLIEQERINTVKKEAEDAKSLIANLRKEMLTRASFQNMVSKSPQMIEIFNILPEVANTPATVLVTGDSGTGKELIARSLHELSDRKSQPFISINCSALPDNLLESELFGYKSGAFTDAKKDKPGMFSRAHGGTIFLDEIGDISTAMQVKLLRVLQEKTFEPLGATESLKVDVRVIVATNKNLGEMVKKGLFREDLFYRINIVVVTLPPLRERRCDIPVLCDHFIERFNSRYNKAITGISKEAESILLAYDFPGNIRELENTMEHAFIFCKDSIIGPGHLPPRFHNGQSGAKVSELSKINDFEELEKLYLEAILAEFGGNKGLVAQRLGIHKATLFRKMNKLGMMNEPGDVHEEKEV